MHMTSEADVPDWSLTSAGSSIQLTWRNLGRVAWSGSRASLPAAPKEPGIYLIKVILDHRHRIYIGETETSAGGCAAMAGGRMRSLTSAGRLPRI